MCQLVERKRVLCGIELVTQHAEHPRVCHEDDPLCTIFPRKGQHSVDDSSRKTPLDFIQMAAAMVVETMR